MFSYIEYLRSRWSIKNPITTIKRVGRVNLNHFYLLYMDRKCQQLAQTIQKVKNNKKVVVFDFDDTFAITELHIGFSEMVLFGDNARKRCLFNLLVQSTKFNVDVIIYTNNSLLDDILTKTTEFLNYCNSYYKKNYPRSDFTDITISKNLSDYGIRIINHATIFQSELHQRGK